MLKLCSSILALQPCLRKHFLALTSSFTEVFRAMQKLVLQSTPFSIECFVNLGTPELRIVPV